MKYISTRGETVPFTSAEAIKRGIAPDGGLFVPETLFNISIGDIKELVDKNYAQRAAEILTRFLDDYTQDEIEYCVNAAYNSNNFDDTAIAPVRILSDQLIIQELWHGPTSAFKYIALQIMPHLLVKAVEKSSEKDEIVILVATSGDTGKAALEGFKNVKGTRIIVFYPESGVSEVQKMQMVTQEGDNVVAIGVRGNFDDAQSGVKAIFADSDMAERLSANGFRFSSANSINWGRLVPQIAYYFSAYADLVSSNEITLGDKINFVVPTGNFGNILAAYYAQRIGLPINKLICASNENNVLTEFIITGHYNRNRRFTATISPSMDILISSNLERLLFEVTDHNAEKVSAWMKELKEEGSYSVDADTHERVKSLFWSNYSTENETLETIKSVYDQFNYVIDTHTAVGIDVYDKYVISTGDLTKTVAVSTASPFKFNKSVAGAILGKEMAEKYNEFELLDILANKCNLTVPSGLRNLSDREVIHKSVTEKNGMKDQIIKLLGLQYC
ncbi:MAG: threonine synthase [Eubacteriales bacterium]|nr:threonine synthase [Eubacteriales bacterium]